jgi:hypothetical protein
VVTISRPHFPLYSYSPPQRAESTRGPLGSLHGCYVPGAAASLDSSPILTDETRLAGLSCGVPSGVGQSRQESQDADVGALALRLQQIEQIWVEREAETMWTGHVPRILTGLRYPRVSPGRMLKLTRRRREMSDSFVKARPSSTTSPTDHK